MTKKVIILIALASLFLSSCKKSQDIDQRIVGTWELESYIVNGTDSASIINKTLGAKCIFTFYPYVQPGGTYGDNTIQWGNDTSNYLSMSGFWKVIINSSNHDSIDSIAHYDHGYTHYAKIYIAIADTAYTNFKVLDTEPRTLWLSFITHNLNHELHFNRIQ